MAITLSSCIISRTLGITTGMLLVYLPKEKVLLEADGFNPPARPLTRTPATISPYTANLEANIARLKLDVERIIPVHYPADSRKITKVGTADGGGKGRPLLPEAYKQHSRSAGYTRARLPAS